MFLASILVHELSHAVVQKPGSPCTRSHSSRWRKSEMDGERSDAESELLTDDRRAITSALWAQCLPSHDRRMEPGLGTRSTRGNSRMVGILNIALGGWYLHLIPGLPPDGGRVLRAIALEIYPAIRSSKRASPQVPVSLCWPHFYFRLIAILREAG